LKLYSHLQGRKVNQECIETRVTGESSQRSNFLLIKGIKTETSNYQ